MTEEQMAERQAQFEQQGGNMAAMMSNASTRFLINAVEHLCQTEVRDLGLPA